MPTLFRAPYGDYNNDVVKSVNGCNMYCVQWDVDSLDWKDPTPEQITKNIVSKLKDGSIILMHNGAKNTPEALPMVIEGIKEKGYEIVPISKILLKGEYYTDVDGKMCPKQTTTTVQQSTTATQLRTKTAKRNCFAVNLCNLILSVNYISCAVSCFLINLLYSTVGCVYATVRAVALVGISTVLTV